MNLLDRFTRCNLLILLAYVVVLLCFFATITAVVDDEFTRGILTLILGRYLGYIDTIYQYEFGSTKSSKSKDEVINRLTKGE